MYKIYADGELLCDSSIQELAIISPIVKLAANSAGSFEFTLPATHPYINSIERRSTIISVYIDEDTTPTFQGIATEEDEDFYKNVTFICEGELTYLNDTIQRQVKYTSLTVRQVLEAIIAVHNSQVSSDKQFTVGQVTINDTITCYTNYNSTLAEIKENLVDEFGGYIRIRYSSGTKYIDYLADSPRTNSQIIKLGENLLDYKSNINDTEIATSILPLGYTLDTQVVEGLDAYLTITSAAADDYHPSGADYIYSSDAVSNYGFIQKVVTWNNITSATDLLAKAEAYLSDIQFENVVLSVSAIDMAYLSSDEEHFKVLDKIRVVSTAHGMDRYFILSEQTLNLNNPEEDQITLGINEQLSLSAKTASTNAEILGKIEQLPTSNMVQSAIDNATALITGSEGGYVVITRNSDGQPVEIKIQDALENPTKIWRWNVNGLGYSSDGGATYGLAMTMNGAIVADYITSGTMYADRIKGGTLTLGGTENVNGQIIMKNANGQTIGTWNKDGLNVSLGTITGTTITGGTLSGATITGGTVSGATITSTSNDCTTTINGGVVTLKPSGGSQVAVNVESSDSQYATRIYADQIKFGWNSTHYVGSLGMNLPGITAGSGFVTITSSLTCSSGVTVSGNLSCSSITVNGTTLTNISFLSGLRKGTFWGTKPSNPTAQDAVNYTYSLVTALQGAGII